MEAIVQQMQHFHLVIVEGEEEVRLLVAGREDLTEGWEITVQGQNSEELPLKELSRKQPNKMVFESFL